MTRFALGRRGPVGLSVVAGVGYLPAPRSSCSLHRVLFTPITRSHSVSEISRCQCGIKNNNPSSLLPSTQIRKRARRFID